MEKIKYIEEKEEQPKINHETLIDASIPLLISYDPVIELTKKEWAIPIIIFLRVCGKISTQNPIITSEIVICYTFEVIKKIEGFDRNEIAEMFNMATKNFVNSFNKKKKGSALVNTIAKQDEVEIQKFIDIVYQKIYSYS
ncbi:MAG: hypothetical protein ABSD71_03605 [Bacteroidales bacterium]|jgi:hypothetical protein